MIVQNVIHLNLGWCRILSNRSWFPGLLGGFLDASVLLAGCHRSGSGSNSRGWRGIAWTTLLNCWWMEMSIAFMKYKKQLTIWIVFLPQRNATLEFLLHLVGLKTKNGPLSCGDLISLSVLCNGPWRLPGKRMTKGSSPLCLKLESLRFFVLWTWEFVLFG